MFCMLEPELVNAPNGYIFSPLAAPTSPSGSTTAGGSITSETLQFSITAVDVNGKETIQSPLTSAITTDNTCPGSGNCSVNLSWSGPAISTGAITYNIYECGQSSGCPSMRQTRTGVTGTSVTLTTIAAGTTPPAVTQAGQMGMGPALLWNPEVITNQVLFTEGTAPSCTSGYDLIFGIASGHRLSFCDNGGSVDQVVGAATTDTLTNKTLTSPVISTIVNTGTLTLPTTTDTLVGRATTDTLTNKTISAGTFTGAGSGSGSILLTGQRDGLVPVNATTTTPCTFGTSGAGCFDKAYVTGYAFNQHATAGQAITYNLPTAATGKQYCAANSNNGSAANTGIITVATSASGQFIIFTDGTLTASGGNVTSGGAADDAACFVGIDSTHWQQFTQSGTWTKH